MSGEVPAFRLDLRSTLGRRFARLREHGAAWPSAARPFAPPSPAPGSEIAVYEWTSWLRIRSDVTGFVPPAGDPDDDDYTGFVPPVFEHDGLALLVVARPQQDIEGQAIGLFHGRLDREELERLRAAVEGTPWSSLPRPSGGHVTAPQLELRHERSPLLIERRFNARSGEFLEAIAPVMDLLDRCLTQVSKGKAATLELAVAVEPDGDHPRRRTIRVTLRNRGLGAIVLTDPRLPRADGSPRLEIRVAERSSAFADVEPRAWTTLALPGLAADAPRSLIIGGNRRLSFDLPWEAPKPGRYLVRVKWQDYEGPLEPGKAIGNPIPFMPLPERGPSYLGAGAYPIRGANLASRRFSV